MKRIKSVTLAVTVGSCSLLSLSAFANKNPEEKMEMMDTNNDGKMSRDEHLVGATKKFQQMDGDKDGKVTLVEMTAAWQKMGKGDGKHGMSVDEKFKKVDANGDGSITLEEKTAAANMMFDKMDGDKDGLLTKAELSAGMEKMKAKHK